MRKFDWDSFPGSITNSVQETFDGSKRLLGHPLHDGKHKPQSKFPERGDPPSDFLKMNCESPLHMQSENPRIKRPAYTALSPFLIVNELD